MRALLDTCTFLWLAFEPNRISDRAAAVINDPANTLALSHVSTLEIVLKHRAGKLPLPETAEQWIRSRRDFYQLEALAIEETVIFRSGELPNGHEDPFDRLIAAHAIVSGYTLLSPDTPLSATLGASRIW